MPKFKVTRLYNQIESSTPLDAATQAWSDGTNIFNPIAFLVEDESGTKSTVTLTNYSFKVETVE